MLLWALAGAVALVMLRLRVPLGIWYKPDNFDREPVKWLSNQGAHAALGLALVLLGTVLLVGLVDWWYHLDDPGLRFLLLLGLLIVVAVVVN